MTRFATTSTSATALVSATATHEPIHVITLIAALSGGVRRLTTHRVTVRSKSVMAWECTTSSPIPNSAAVSPIHPRVRMEARNAIPGVDLDFDGTVPSYRTVADAAVRFRALLLTSSARGRTAGNRPQQTAPVRHYCPYRRADANPYAFQSDQLA